MRDTIDLNEVIVTGYSRSSKATFTGAASVVAGATFGRRSDASFTRSLEGVATGMQYDNATGSPAIWGSLSVRGIGTLSSSSAPLYVVDGVPVNADLIFPVPVTEINSGFGVAQNPSWASSRPK